MRLADARVADVPAAAGPTSSAPRCAGLPSAAPPAPPDAPAVVAGWPGWPALAGITRVDATHYTLARDLIDRALAAPTPLIGAARIVPAIADGQPAGFKLYAMRPGSPLVVMGLANGDTLRAINGLPLTSADRALEAYSRLRATDHLTLEVTRRGQPLTLRYQIVD
ncbi:MAG: hypothetical protein JNK64_08540 [Myxococcales bacterium]|nr:hypothetical protein [Myxococcales bacterium]